MKRYPTKRNRYAFRECIDEASGKGIYTFLQNNRRALRESWNEYIELRSDCYDIDPDQQPWMTEEERLEELYNKPTPTPGAYIDKIRNPESFGVCPYCGRPELGSVDHFLPQSRYPQFSLLIQNLVPACNSCNREKTNTIAIDDNFFPHPNYDNLNQRLYFFTFERNRTRPKIQVQINPELNTSLYQKMEFLFTYTKASIKIAKDARRYFTHLVKLIKKNKIPSPQALEEHIQRRIEHSLIQYETNNEIEGVFYFSLQQSPETLAYLETLIP